MASAMIMWLELTLHRKSCSEFFFFLFVFHLWFPNCWCKHYMKIFHY